VASLATVTGCQVVLRRSSAATGRRGNSPAADQRTPEFDRSIFCATVSSERAAGSPPQSKTPITLNLHRTDGASPRHELLVTTRKPGSKAAIGAMQFRVNRSLTLAANSGALGRTVAQKNGSVETPAFAGQPLDYFRRRPVAALDRAGQTWQPVTVAEKATFSRLSATGPTLGRGAAGLLYHSRIPDSLDASETIFRRNEPDR